MYEAPEELVKKTKEIVLKNIKETNYKKENNIVIILATIASVIIGIIRLLVFITNSSIGLNLDLIGMIKWIGNLNGIICKATLPLIIFAFYKKEGVK